MVYLYILRTTLSVVVSCCFFYSTCLLYTVSRITGKDKGLVIFVVDDNA